MNMLKKKLQSECVTFLFYSYIETKIVFFLICQFLKYYLWTSLWHKPESTNENGSEKRASLDKREPNNTIMWREKLETNQAIVDCVLRALWELLTAGDCQSPMEPGAPEA